VNAAATHASYRLVNAAVIGRGIIGGKSLHSVSSGSDIGRWPSRLYKEPGVWRISCKRLNGSNGRQNFNNARLPLPAAVVS
jgi:hypothetical protein